MMQHFKRRWTFLLATLAVALAIPGTAYSSGFGITVTPGKFEAAMTPGATVNVPVTVGNTSGNSVHILTSLTDFAVNGNGDYVFNKVGSEEYSLFKWATIRPREFDLPTDTSQQVQLTLSIPNDSKMSGEYAGIAFFQTRPERRRGGFAFSARVASKFYVTIPGTVKIDGAITKMSSSATAGGQMYKVVFKNTGNAHTYLRGQITVQKGGSVIYTIPMQDNMLVERGGDRTITVKGNALKAGAYQAIATIDYGGKTETGGEINIDVR
jgi:hypothetical protein